MGNPFPFCKGSLISFPYSPDPEGFLPGVRRHGVEAWVWIEKGVLFTWWGL